MKSKDALFDRIKWNIKKELTEILNETGLKYIFIADYEKIELLKKSLSNIRDDVIFIDIQQILKEDIKKIDKIINNVEPVEEHNESK
ncbi:TPA: hypothetical protein TUY21_001460, partial [Streptococcus equi subsp. zooepidemicus]|nr:hypothetical protein [Streptococcus equi subsp. zooepidemicus]